MKTQLTLLPAVLLMAVACAPVGTTGEGAESGFIKELPEGVLAVAAPFQDLNAVVLRPEDGCYWYRHRGPVETTFLPLRTVEGRPICTRPDTPAGQVG